MCLMGKLNWTLKFCYMLTNIQDIYEYIYEYIQIAFVFE